MDQRGQHGESSEQLLLGLTNPSDVLKEAGMEIGDQFHSLSSAISSAFSLFSDSEQQSGPAGDRSQQRSRGDHAHRIPMQQRRRHFTMSRGPGLRSKPHGRAEAQAFLFARIPMAPRAYSGRPLWTAFAKLAELDSNHDLKIDSHDSAWSSLAVWTDSNGNGVVDSGELQTLTSVDLASIDLAGVAPSTDVIDGNPISHTSTVTFTDGSTSGDWRRVVCAQHGEYDLQRQLQS